ncbi:GDSL esterase/lipase At5g03610-like [Bidens hawaiensis]|uniref:GDSL esterase/lipase At5g03610-like n=1 Tax=Bidens hawaiensis TaxID=980011 RepID=UPI00404A09FA
MELTFSLLFLFLVFAGGTVFADENDDNKHADVKFRPLKLFVFGDSYADTGNNPKEHASSWKPPYGLTFPGKPAGRFSDGRVLTDYVAGSVMSLLTAFIRTDQLLLHGYSLICYKFAAKFMGIKSPLPYAFRKYARGKLRGGVNFACGGTGVFDTGNFQPNMTPQIGFLEGFIKEGVYTKRDLESSLALVMVSGNDHGAYTLAGGKEQVRVKFDLPTYELNPFNDPAYRFLIMLSKRLYNMQDLPAFITKVINQTAINMKAIHDMGVHRVLVANLQPIGCLPQETVTTSYQQCKESQNTAANFHNQLLQQAVTGLNSNTKASSFLILDNFSAFNTVLTSKGDLTGNLKFDTPYKPCCIGTRSGVHCGNLDENGKELYTVCEKPDSTFFWDTVHPTQAGWSAVYLALRSSLNQMYN